MRYPSKIIFLILLTSLGSCYSDKKIIAHYFSNRFLITSVYENALDSNIILVVNTSLKKDESFSFSKPINTDSIIVLENLYTTPSIKLDTIYKSHVFNLLFVNSMNERIENLPYNIILNDSIFIKSSNTSENICNLNIPVDHINVSIPLFNIDFDHRFTDLFCSTIVLKIESDIPLFHDGIPYSFGNYSISAESKTENLTLGKLDSNAFISINLLKLGNYRKQSVEKKNAKSLNNYIQLWNIEQSSKSW